MSLTVDLVGVAIHYYRTGVVGPSTWDLLNSSMFIVHVAIPYKLVKKLNGRRNRLALKTFNFIQQLKRSANDKSLY